MSDFDKLKASIDKVREITDKPSKSGDSEETTTTTSTTTTQTPQ